MKMAEYICVGDVADVFVEYHGEEDSEYNNSGSDFEDEIVQLSDEEPDIVISAEPADSDDEIVGVEHVLVPDDTGVITQVINSPVKQRSGTQSAFSQSAFSQVLNPTQSQASRPLHAPELPTAGVVHNQLQQYSEVDASDDSDFSDSDTEYMPHSEDSGEDSDVVELRRHARKFKKRMRDTKSWIGSEPNGAVPIDLVANMEEQLEGEEKN
jgi:hypothetical protein